MSSEARMRAAIDDAVRQAVEPLERAVDELNARLVAVEGERGARGAGPQKRAAGGRTAKARAGSDGTDATSEDASAKTEETK